MCPSVIQAINVISVVHISKGNSGALRLPTATIGSGATQGIVDITLPLFSSQEVAMPTRKRTIVSLNILYYMLVMKLYG